MGNVSKTILKISIGITSFTNSLIQDYVLADLKFYLPNKEDLYLPCGLSIKLKLLKSSLKMKFYALRK